MLLQCLHQAVGLVHQVVQRGAELLRLLDQAATSWVGLPAGGLAGLAVGLSRGRWLWPLPLEAAFPLGLVTGSDTGDTFLSSLGLGDRGFRFRSRATRCGSRPSAGGMADSGLNGIQTYCLSLVEAGQGRLVAGDAQFPEAQPHRAGQVGPVRVHADRLPGKRRAGEHDFGRPWAVGRLRPDGDVAVQVQGDRAVARRRRRAAGATSRPGNRRRLAENKQRAFASATCGNVPGDVGKPAIHVDGQVDRPAARRRWPPSSRSCRRGRAGRGAVRPMRRPCCGAPEGRRSKGTGIRSGPAVACRPWRRWCRARPEAGHDPGQSGRCRDRRCQRRRRGPARGPAGSRRRSPAARGTCRRRRAVRQSYWTICGTLPSRHWA